MPRDITAIIEMLQTLEQLNNSEFSTPRQEETILLLNHLLKVRLREQFEFYDLPLTVAEVRVATESNYVVSVRFLTSDTWQVVLTTPDAAIAAEARRVCVCGLTAEKLKEVMAPLQRNEIIF
jgi:hypothetical protein